jgi:hypothetical protein
VRENIDLGLRRGEPDDFGAQAAGIIQNKSAPGVSLAVPARKGCSTPPTTVPPTASCLIGVGDAGPPRDL